MLTWQLTWQSADVADDAADDVALTWQMTWQSADVAADVADWRVYCVSRVKQRVFNLCWRVGRVRWLFFTRRTLGGA